MRSRGFLPRLICVILSLCLCVGPASANMQGVMQGMFNSMINVTPASNFETQSQGVYAGGSVYIRNQVSTIRPIVFDPPRLRADCSGIDAYAGSFSFINKDALINMMRNIASNGIAYAFKMAIGTLCPRCDNLMAELQKMADTMNKFNINSCKAAKGPMSIVQSWDDTARELGRNMDSIGGVVAGIGQDFNDLLNGTGSPSKTPDQQMREAAPTVAAEETEFNTAWKAVKEADIPSWYQSTMDETAKVRFSEIVMSFTGTYIQHPVTPEEGGTPRSSAEPYPVMVDFMDFLKGATSKLVYRCDTADKCLFPTTELTPIPSMKDSVDLMLFGTAGAPGIVDKVTQRNGGTALSLDERRFIEAAPGAIYANLRMVSANRESARTYADAVSSYLAVEMTAHLLLDVVRKARIGTAKNRGSPKGGRDPGLSKYIDDLRNLESKIMKEQTLAYGRLDGLNKQIELAQRIRTNLNQAMASSARPSLVGAPVAR